MLFVVVVLLCQLLTQDAHATEGGTRLMRRELENLKTQTSLKSRQADNVYYYLLDPGANVDMDPFESAVIENNNRHGGVEFSDPGSADTASNMAGVIKNRVSSETVNSDEAMLSSGISDVDSDEALEQNSGFSFLQLSAPVPGIPGLGPLKAARTCFKALLACFCVAFLVKCWTTYCTSENLNPRQIPWIRKLFRSWGYDDFDQTKVLVQICEARDMKHKGERGLIVDSMYRGKIAFWYNVFTTDARVDGEYEQTRMLTVPQGAASTRISILVNSLVGSDTEVGHLTLNTKMDILDRDKSFWGRKQTYRLKNDKNEFAGTLSIKFRKLTPAQEENYYLPICDGIDNESGLGAEVMKIAVKLQLPDNLRKIKGELKCRILSMILQGKVREVSQNVEQDAYFCKIQHCSLGMLDFDVRKAELIEAKKRGLNEPPKRFYFCVYDRRKDAETMIQPPVVFTAVTSIKRVDVSARRNDEFTVRWEIPGLKDRKKHEDSMTLRAKDRDRDVWIHGLDQLMGELANLQVDLNNAAELARKKAHFLKISQASIEAYGCPSTAEDWKGWYDMMESQGASPEVIKEVYKDLAIWITRQGLFQEWKQVLREEEAEGKLDSQVQDAKFHDPERYWKENVEEETAKTDWGDYVSGVFSGIAGYLPTVENYGTLEPNAVDVTADPAGVVRLTADAMDAKPSLNVSDGGVAGQTAGAAGSGGADRNVARIDADLSLGNDTSPRNNLVGKGQPPAVWNGKKGGPFPGKGSPQFKGSPKGSPYFKGSPKESPRPLPTKGLSPRYDGKKGNASPHYGKGYGKGNPPVGYGKGSPPAVYGRGSPPVGYGKGSPKKGSPNISGGKASPQSPHSVGKGKDRKKKGR